MRCTIPPPFAAGSCASSGARRSTAGDPLRSWLDRFGTSASDDARPIALAASEPSPDAQLISRELERAIAQVVRALPRKLRDPFLLAASGDHRYEEIATLLGIPAGTVKWRISEARRLIRLKLDRLGHGDPR